MLASVSCAVPVAVVANAQCTFIHQQLRISVKKPLCIKHTTLLNVGRTHGAASFLNIHREFTKHWGTNGMGADRFSIISAVAGSAFVPLPQFGLTVVLLCDCIVAFARGFYNIFILAFGTTLVVVNQ